MKRILSHILIFLLGIGIAQAQLYPVQVVPQLVPPYSLKLSDYQTTSSEKLFVNLLLTDVTEAGRRIRLKMYIEGQGLSITTQDFVSGANPIFLDGGINQRLSNLDLRAYFDLNNLIGINATQYNSVLPDGVYQFSFEAYDYLSGQRLSNKATIYVNLLLNDPPFLNLPFDGDLHTAIQPQNIVFSWTPRHLNATNVQYEFTLKELWDTQVDPQAAFLISPPLYQTRTYATTLLYGPAQTTLLDGKTYGWQVRAIVSDGISETSVFRNDGYSEVYSFTNVSACASPTFVLSEATSSQAVDISWQSSDHLRYEVQYRKISDENYDWFSVYAYNPSTTIKNLEAGTTYEFRVGGECVLNEGFAYHTISQFTTPTDEEAAYYNCGVQPNVEIDNQDPLLNLGVNEVFTAGDFPVTVKYVEGGMGSYSGWGFIVVPYLADTRIRVEFRNIQINTDYQLINGVVETSYDPTWGNVASIDDSIDEIFGDSGDVMSYDAFSINVDSVYVNAGGQVILVDNYGVEHPIDTDTPVIITDSEGEQYQVNEDGTVTNLGTQAEGGQPQSDNTEGITSTGVVTQISSQDVSVVFNASGYYATDILDEGITDASYRNHYESISMATGGAYPVRYKLITDHPQSDDEIMATVTLSNGKTPDDVIFKTLEGTEIPVKSWVGNTVTLELEKRFDFVKEEILATVKPEDSTESQTIAGKLNLWHTGYKEINVTVVGVNGAAIASDLEAQLNEIYNPVGVVIHLTTDVLSVTEGTWDIDNDGKLDVGDSDLLAQYTSEERAVFNYYKTQSTVDQQQYYLFLMGSDIAPSNASMIGLMPLMRQYGFIFNPSSSTQAYVMAHELGHGVFALEHPFEEYAIAQGGTDLLMDYGSGNAFTQLDWQNIHAPGLQLYVYMQEDQDGEYSYTAYADKAFQIIRCGSINNEYNFTFDKEPSKLLYSTDEYGGTVAWRLTIDNKQNFTGGKQEIQKETSNLNGAGVVVYVLDYGQVKIEFIDHVRKDETTKQKLAALQGYLFPENGAESIAQDIENLGNISSNALDSEKIEEIRAIANCGSHLFSPKQKLEIIKYIAANGLDESSEDLVLDLLASTESGMDSKTLVDNILEDENLIKSLTKIDNVTSVFGFKINNEDNFDRLAKELVTLFNKGYTKEERDNINKNLGDEQKLYFYGHIESDGSYLICDKWNISSSLVGSNIEFTEKTYQLIVANTGGVASYDPCHFVDEKSYNIPITSKVSVYVDAVLSSELGITSGTYVLPAFAYYILIEAENNKKLKENIEFFLFAASVITPFDELYLLGKALKLSKAGFRVARLSAAKAFAKNKKLIVNLDNAGVQLKNSDVNGKLDEYVEWVDEIASTGGRFIAKTGAELRKHLDDLVDIPIGTTHRGSVYRSLTETSQKEYGALAGKMTDHTVYSSWGRYDLDKAENAMYLSKTITGNKTEVLHYLDDWKAWNTYEFKNVEVENLLDLTDDVVRSKLGTQFDDLVRTVGDKGDVYEMTNEIASWARNKGYNGIIAPGARGVKDYDNIILFEQSFIDNMLDGVKVEKIVK